LNKPFIDVTHGNGWQHAISDPRSRLKTPPLANGYNHQNPLRVESAAEAARIDAAILTAWRDHPRRYLVGPTPDFLAKARTVIDIVRSELPECCRHHIVPQVVGSADASSAAS
jgi:hypothetical protein